MKINLQLRPNLVLSSRWIYLHKWVGTSKEHNLNPRKVINNPSRRQRMASMWNVTKSNGHQHSCSRLLSFTSVSFLCFSSSTDLHLAQKPYRLTVATGWWDLAWLILLYTKYVFALAAGATDYKSDLNLHWSDSDCRSTFSIAVAWQGFRLDQWIPSGGITSLFPLCLNMKSRVKAYKKNKSSNTLLFTWLLYFSWHWIKTPSI